MTRRPEELLDEFGERLHHYLLGRVRDRATAEDLLQTVMLRVVRHRRKLTRVENVRAWIFTIARNEARRYLAKAGRSPARTEGEVELLAAPEADGDDADLEALRAAVGRLSPERYEVVTLKVWQRLTFAEIGEVLGVSPNTAASRYRYALEDLKRMLVKSDEPRTA